MPQNNPITIKDGATTPADHVFNPVSTLNGQARFENTASSVTLAGREALTVGLKRPAPGGRQTFATEVSLERPKVVTGTGGSGEEVTVIQFTNRAVVTLVADPRSTAQERKDLRVLIANALLSTAIGQAADQAENFW